MNAFLRKTFGGLSLPYYLRHFCFGLIFYCFFLYQIVINSANPLAHLGVALFFTLCQFLYPYSRFVYESIIGYIMGENVFFVNVLLMFSVKAITMALCWIFSIFIAPLGLLYLYFYYTKQEKQASNQD